MLSQTPPDWQRQSDIEALLSLVQRVVDDHHTALLLPLALVEAKDASVLLRTGDVVRVRQDGGGNRSRGRTFRRMSKRSGNDCDRSLYSYHIIFVKYVENVFLQFFRQHLLVLRY